MVLDVADDAPITYSVFPITPQALARQGFANVSWVFKLANPYSQKPHQTRLDLFV